LLRCREGRPESKHDWWSAVLRALFEHPKPHPDWHWAKQEGRWSGRKNCHKKCARQVLEINILIYWEYCWFLTSWASYSEHCFQTQFPRQIPMQNHLQSFDLNLVPDKMISWKIINWATAESGHISWIKTIIN